MTIARRTVANTKDWRDALAWGMIASIVTFAGWFVANHPDPINFGTFGTLAGGAICAMRWFDLRDDKVGDA
jgi:hypothetical protein